MLAYLHGSRYGERPAGARETPSEEVKCSALVLFLLLVGCTPANAGLEQCQADAESLSDTRYENASATADDEAELDYMSDRIIEMYEEDLTECYARFPD